MFFKLILFSCVLVFCEAEYEGEFCTRNGTTGTCTNVRRCKTAIADIKKKKFPQVCGFDKEDPIVCCFDHVVPTILQLTTRRPLTTTTYVPTGNDGYPDYMEELECEPVPAEKTSKKTGQKAFDKCIEYQEKYVYPCQSSLLQNERMKRYDYCSHDNQELIVGGSRPSPSEVSHIVALGFGKDKASAEWLCAGSIISETFVLTAASCTIITRDHVEVKYILIRSQTQSDEKETPIYIVKRIVRHPGFLPPKKYDNIALIETEKPFQLSKTLIPACLHIGNPVKDDYVTSITLDQFSNKSVNFLEKVSFKKMSYEDCASIFNVTRLLRRGIDNSTQQCYSDPAIYKDICKCNDGLSIHVKNPDVHCTNLIVGVESFKYWKRVDTSLVFTRVSAYIPWIESIVWP